MWQNRKKILPAAGTVILKNYPACRAIQLKIKGMLGDLQNSNQGFFNWISGGNIELIGCWVNGLIQLFY